MVKFHLVSHDLKGCGKQLYRLWKAFIGMNKENAVTYRREKRRKETREKIVITIIAINIKSVINWQFLDKQIKTYFGRHLYINLKRN